MITGRILAALAVLAAGCAQVEEKAPEPQPAPPPQVEAPAPAPAPRLESKPLKYLVGRNLKAIPTRPLNVRSRCSYRDAVGTKTSLNLLVKEAEVKTFAARVNIPKRGQCRFELKDFEQAEWLPQALLKARDGSGCSVRLWEQDSRVTIAFNNCPQACEGDAFSYLWPIMVESRSGRCF